MARSSRDRISVELGSLRATLFEQARARGTSPSEVIRAALADALRPEDAGDSKARSLAPILPAAAPRVRVSLRLDRRQATELQSAANLAGLSIGTYLTGLAAGVPILTSGLDRRGHIETLTKSCAALSTLSRNIHHLIDLLNRGQMRAALEYRDMLNTLEGDIRAHLKFASSALADLRPRRGGADADSRLPR